MEYLPRSLGTTKGKQPSEVLMGKFASFVGGVLAGATALGVVAYLVTEYSSREEVTRDSSDDGCLAESPDPAA